MHPEYSRITVMSEEELTNHTGRNHAVRFSIVNTVTVSIAVILAVCLLLIAHFTNVTTGELQNVTNEYIECEHAVDKMSNASLYLTSQARMFALTCEPAYLRRYLIEAQDAQRREQAIRAFEEQTPSGSAWSFIDSAMQASKELEQRELYAMKLVTDAKKISDGKGAKELEGVTLAAEDARLSDDEKLEKARELVFDESYQASRDYIDRLLDQCNDTLVEEAHARQNAIETQLSKYLLAQQVLTTLLAIAIIVTSIIHYILIMRPLHSVTERLNENESVDVAGAAELRQLANAYNSAYRQNEEHQARLSHTAEHDALTDLLNRSAYDKLYKEHLEHQALLLIDVDYFKNINDDYGHDVGDSVLRAIADALRSTFRSTDYPCRIGGDEFAVIMPGMNPNLRNVIEARIETIRAKVNALQDHLPPLTLSIGVAFSDDVLDDGTGDTSLYKAADIALYHVKDTGRNGYAFYSDLKQS